MQGERDHPLLFPSRQDRLLFLRFPTHAVNHGNTLRREIGNRGPPVQRLRVLKPREPGARVALHQENVVITEYAVTETSHQQEPRMRQAAYGRPFRSLLVLCMSLLVTANLAACSTSTASATGPESHPTATKSIASSLKQVFAPAPAFARSASAGDATTLADVAEMAVPSVVNIAAENVVSGPQSPMLNDPMFREFFGVPEQPRERTQQALGSGVVVAADGLVLTNNHVVEHAKGVVVTLHDGQEVDAEVVGSDPKSDLAVLRLKGKLPKLVPAKFGDSTNLRLGDVVLAIGNPFGVGQTVTMGIVSAKGRSHMGIVDYEDFIQTDAAINPGNSGGALVNTNGELVGINTAILSRSGGNHGIGFAIPSNMIAPIMKSLVQDGRVVRGWLGVAIQDMDRELAKGLGVAATSGVLVSDVSANSPAAKAGLQRGDVITAVDGKATDSGGTLRNIIAARSPDSVVTLAILRNGKNQQVKVKLGTLADETREETQTREGAGVLSGVTATNLSPQARAQLQLPDSITKGVVITKVARNSKAARAGLRPGDVILEVNRRAVGSTKEFWQLSKQRKDSVLLLVARGGVTNYIAISK